MADKPKPVLAWGVSKNGKLEPTTYRYEKTAASVARMLGYVCERVEIRVVKKRRA